MLLVAGLCVAVFAVAFAALGILGIARRGLATSQQAMAALRDSDLDDATRERHARAASLQLFRVFGAILARSAVALGLAAMPLALGEWTGLAPAAEVVAFLSRLDVLLGLLLVLTALMLLWSRRRARWA